MRLSLLAAIALGAALLTPSAGIAGNVFGPKIDDAVAAAAVVNTLDAPLSVIVYSKDTAKLNRSLSLTPTNLLPALGAESVTIPVGRLAELAASRYVTYVAADVPMGSTAETTAAEWVDGVNAWLLNRAPSVIGAPWAWRRGYTAQGIGIAVIDSGTDPVDDVKDRLSQTILEGQNNGHVDDRVGHGTFVASLAGGYNFTTRFIGVAPAADIYAVNVSRQGGVFSSDVIAALQWVEKKAGMRSKNLRVVVLALTEAAPSSYHGSALDAMVERLWKLGIVVISAAGNKGADNAVYAPANEPFSISVGALDDAGTLATDDDAETSWSTRGFTLDGHSKPDLLAPGRRVMGRLEPDSLFGLNAPVENIVPGGYALASGTSFAAPQVAGAVALLLHARPTLTPDQVKWLLKQTARPVAGASAGAVDIRAAIEYAGPVGSANEGVATSAYAAGSWSEADFKSAHTGNGWSGNGWSGNGWSGNGWSGNGWSGNGWSGNGWSGNGWSWFQGAP